MPEGGGGGRGDESDSKFVPRFRGGDAPDDSFRNGDFIRGGGNVTVSGKRVIETGGESGGFVIETVENSPRLREEQRKAARRAQVVAQIAATRAATEGFRADQARFSEVIAQFGRPSPSSDPFGQPAPLPFQAEPLPEIPEFDNSLLPGVGTTEVAEQRTAQSLRNPAAAFAPDTVKRSGGQALTKPQTSVGGSPIERVLNQRTSLGNQGKF